MTEEKRGVRFRAPQPAEEFQQMLSKLMNSTESIKEIERIIKTPDSETKYTYEIQVDSATGKQKVIEKFTTTKKECRLCGGYTAQVYECEDCHVKVCPNDMRHVSWSFSADRYGRAEGLYDHDNKYDHMEEREKIVCMNCYKSKYRPTGE